MSKPTKWPTHKAKARQKKAHRRRIMRWLQTEQERRRSVPRMW